MSRDVYWATRCKGCNRRGATRHLVSRSQTPESASKPVLCVDCADVWRAEGHPEAAALLPHGSYNAYRKKAGNDKQKTYEGILDDALWVCVWGIVSALHKTPHFSTFPTFVPSLSRF